MRVQELLYSAYSSSSTDQIYYVVQLSNTKLTLQDKTAAEVLSHSHVTSAASTVVAKLAEGGHLPLHNEW